MALDVVVGGELFDFSWDRECVMVVQPSSSASMYYYCGDWGFFQFPACITILLVVVSLFDRGLWLRGLSCLMLDIWPHVVEYETDIRVRCVDVGGSCIIVQASVNHSCSVAVLQWCSGREERVRQNWADSHFSVDTR